LKHVLFINSAQSTSVICIIRVLLSLLCRPKVILLNNVLTNLKCSNFSYHIFSARYYFWLNIINWICYGVHWTNPILFNITLVLWHNNRWCRWIFEIRLYKTLGINKTCTYISYIKFLIQSVPGIVALMKWKTRDGEVKNACQQSEKCAVGTTIVDGIWWRAMFLCSCLNFLCKFLAFQLAEPKKQHTKNISSIIMYMRVTIPGTPGIKAKNSEEKERKQTLSA
jgi:hypothetical protein